MPCARCGSEPDADLTRFAEFEADEEVRSLLLCPECSYGFNMLLGAYIARRLEPTAALA